MRSDELAGAGSAAGSFNLQMDRHPRILSEEGSHLNWIIRRSGIIRNLDGMQGGRLAAMINTKMKMKTAAAFCLLCLVAAPADAQKSAPTAQGSESMLIALENGWNQAQLHHDSKALDGLIADTFES